MSLSIRDTLTAGLRKLAGQVADRRPILKAWGDELAKITNGSFNNSGWRAEPWAPLKSGTIRQKIAKGRNSGILKRDLVLLGSFRTAEITNSGVTVGTDRLYAGYHQFGAPRAGIPARPMLPFTGGPDNAKLAPWAREKLAKIGQAKLDSLLKK